MAPDKIQKKLIGALHRDHPCLFKKGLVDGQSSTDFYHFAVQETSRGPNITEFWVQCKGCQKWFCLPALKIHLMV